MSGSGRGGIVASGKVSRLRRKGRPIRTTPTGWTGIVRPRSIRVCRNLFGTQVWRLARFQKRSFRRRADEKAGNCSSRRKLTFTSLSGAGGRAHESVTEGLRSCTCNERRRPSGKGSAADATLPAKERRSGMNSINTGSWRSVGTNGDLSQYSSKQNIKEKNEEIYGQDKDYMNEGHALWQFANEREAGRRRLRQKGRKHDRRARR